MTFGLGHELDEAYQRLLVQDVLRRAPGGSLQALATFDAKEIALLVSRAGELSLDEGHAKKTIAYEIATRAVAIFGTTYSGLQRAAELVLTRLGNFPGRDLMRTRFGASKGSLWEQLEMVVREAENTVIDGSGRKWALTDFQFDALQAFASHNSISLSAPTSAGKSFLLTLEVMRRISQGEGAIIAYVVPTRALIRQVVIDLREAFAKSSLSFPIIRSIPRPTEPGDADAGAVYVLTQERLLSLLVQEGAPQIAALIVDEAQEIGSGARGILLQTAVERLLIRNPSAHVIFATPMAQNPEYLLGLFKRSDGHPQSERHSPVSQNIVMVEPSDTGPHRVRLKLLAHERHIPVGEVEVGFRFGGSSLRRMALFAAALADKDGDDFSCIIYANGARDAERIAGHLCRVIKPTESIDPDLADFIDYLNDHIHPEYDLAAYLRHGIAFHYSNMPGNVRTTIEDLFKERKIKFLCCTSTLLQGVNLPARHLIVETPERGHNKPMERADFVNLAGRAGRLRREFHGNVWCLMPERWRRQCFEGEPLQRLRSSFTKALGDGGRAIRQAFEDEHGLDDPATAVAAMGRIFTEFVQRGRALEPEEGESTEGLKLTMELMEKLDGQVTLPKDLFAKNAGVHPRRLEALFSHFTQQDSLESFVPIRPFAPGNVSRLREIFQCVQQLLAGVSNNSYGQHAKVAQMWIHQNPLGYILASEMNYRRQKALEGNKKFRPANVIYSMVKTIEHDIRFLYVKHLRAYHDVLSEAFRRRGKLVDLVPLHLFLECGASKPVPLNLISLGLSRTTALLLAKNVTLASDATPEMCLRKCKEAIANARGMKLPEIVRREVRSFADRS